MLFIVFFFIESDYSRDINVIKDITIFVWMLTILMSSISLFNWSHEGYKLSWDNPIEVSIFNSLIVFIFFNVESFKIIPAKFDSIF